MQRVHIDKNYEGRAGKRRRIDDGESGSVCGQDQSDQWPSNPSGESFGNSTLYGHGRLWQGHHYGTQVNHYYQAQPSQDKYLILLESLTFDRMDARLRNVATALQNTCQWLQSHEKFRVWVDTNRIQEHGGFLWIKGKPGSGKSTVMKEIVAWAEREWPTQIILTYFFNARSPNALEKSRLGLYRSLVHQLLTKCPDGRVLFVTRFASKERHGKIVEEWTETELQNFLIELITTRPQCTTVFIDALDEGSTADVRCMVDYLQVLMQYSVSTGAAFHVCLASRHYPHITVQKSLSIVLEKQPAHNRDIEFYIHSQLLGPDGLQRDQLRRRVRDRSAGVFLWVVLVVSTLNKLFDQGKSLTSMFQKLDETPQDLHQMFTNILSRDRDDINESIVLLRWVLFALEPLRPVELYVAVQPSAFMDVCHDVAPTEETMTTFLLNCSRGLLEVTAAQPPVMQFIHETVRDFLTRTSTLTEHVSAEHGNPIVLPDFRGDSCHIMIAEECLQYLIALGQQTLPTSAEQHPLARYAAAYWWQHVRACNYVCSPRLLALIQDLMMNQTTLLNWVRHSSVDEPIMRINTELTVSDLAPPLHYAACIGIAELVTVLLKKDADVNARGGYYGNALQAASEGGHEKIVQMLVDAGADVNAQGGYYGNALQAASKRGHEKIVQMLVDAGADVNASLQYSLVLSFSILGAKLFEYFTTFALCCERVLNKFQAQL